MTDYLFAEPSFIQGIASIGNISGVIDYNESDTPDIADEKAMICDWMVVGSDIKCALVKYEQEQQKQEKD